MKKVIIVIAMSLGLAGSANAFDPVFTPGLFFAAQQGFLFWGGTQSNQKPDPAMHKMVVASWAGETGYQFEITQFEYNQNPSKFDLK